MGCDQLVTECDLYNGTVTGDVACSINANTGASANHAGPTVLTLNDKCVCVGGGTEFVSGFQNTGRGWWNECEIAATLRTGDSMKANLALFTIRSSS